MADRLVVRSLRAGYTHAPILHDVSLDLGRGEMVGLLGANGAGKTTLLRALSGALRAWSGRVELAGTDVTRAPAWRRVRLGLAHVPEGRHTLAGMTVAENLTVAGLVAGRDAPPLAEIYELFPRLGERAGQVADTMSGGEQQMLVVGRALMTRPAFLLVDEMSAGLAPVTTMALVEALEGVRDRGVGVLVVEQSPHYIADSVDRVYLLQGGRITAEGSLAGLGGADRLAEIYLGVH